MLYTHSQIIINLLTKNNNIFTVLTSSNLAFSVNTSKKNGERDFFIYNYVSKHPSSACVLDYVDKKHLGKNINLIKCGVCGKNTAIVLPKCFPTCADKARCADCLPENIPDCAGCNNNITG